MYHLPLQVGCLDRRVCYVLSCEIRLLGDIVWPDNNNNKKE